MIRKISPAFVIIVMICAFSCEDSADPAKVNVSPPPRNIDINARLEYCLNTSEVADLYYRLNSGSWIYLNSVTTTGSGCPNIGTISVNNGDVVEFGVLESASGFGVTYRGRVGAGCPNDTYTGYCTDLTYGPYFTHTVTSNTTALSIQVEVVYSYPYCGYLSTCISK